MKSFALFLDNSNIDGKDDNPVLCLEIETDGPIFDKDDVGVLVAQRVTIKGR